MNPGGIQKCISNYLAVYQNAGYDTFWIAPKHPSVDSGFYNVLNRVSYLQGNRQYIKNVLREYEEILTLSFSAFGMERMMECMQDFDNVRHFFLIPHFKNPEIYLEELFFSLKKQKKYFPLVGMLYSRYIKENKLFYINPKHGFALSEHYGLDKNHVHDHVCKRVSSINFFDENAARLRASTKKNNFSIITVARFEFPHKGYVLGLINCFCKIKEVIPNAKLIIIGYGEGHKDVLRCISNLPEDYQSDVEYVGKISYNELQRFYQKAHVSVSLAGSVSDSARFGVPPLIAQHYTHECKGYGFFHENPDKILCDEAGEDLIPYIIRVYHMDDNEYLELCKKNYEVIKDYMMKDYDPLWMTKIKQVSTQYAENRLICLLKRQMKWWTFIYRFNMLLTRPSVFFDKLFKKIHLLIK